MSEIVKSNIIALILVTILSLLAIVFGIAMENIFLVLGGFTFLGIVIWRLLVSFS